MTSTVVVSVASITLALLVLGASVVGAFVYLRQTTVPASTGQAGLEERVAGLEVTVRGLPSLWEEERQRAKKHADAAKTANRDAARKLEEVAEIVEAVEQIPGLDEAGGGQIEMQRVLPRLAGTAQPGQEDRVAAIAHLMR